MKTFKTFVNEDTETYPGVNDLTAEAMIDAAIKSGLKVKWQVNKDKSGVDVQITGNNDKGWSKFFKIADKENEKHLTGRDAYEPKMSNKYNKYKGKFKAESVNEGYASNDPKVKAIAKKFKKDIQKLRKSDGTIEEGEKLFDAVFDYLMTTEISGRMKNPDFAWDKVNEFIHDSSKFGLGKV